MRTRPLITLTAAAVLVAGCSTTAADGPSTSPTAAVPATAGPVASRAPGAAAPVAADPAWAHVHNLTLAGDELLIGTHEGLWAQRRGQPARRVSEQSFDVMGFAAAESAMYASGHPGRGMDAPADLGLQVSTDNGVTWSPVSLEGQVDFHRLRAVGTVVAGLSAHDGRFLRSTDSGSTWADLGTPALFDFAVDPADPDLLVATSQAGPVRSTDGGRTLTPIPDTPLLAFLAWTGPTLYAIAADGTLHTSTDTGTTWTQVGQLAGTPRALAADGSHVVALAGTTVVESTDGGRTFTPRITGLAD